MIYAIILGGIALFVVGFLTAYFLREFAEDSEYDPDEGDPEIDDAEASGSKWVKPTPPETEEWVRWEEYKVELKPGEFEEWNRRNTEKLLKDPSIQEAAKKAQKRKGAR